MTEKLSPANKRLDVVDALRGFALLAIVLLHNLEHYNLYFIPENQPEWLLTLDAGVWETTFFLLAGKAYATFSLLFGFSFFIQFRNAQRKGIDFRARFAWRMFLLLLISQLHALFYNGDILLLYAVVGLVLIPVAKLKDKTVLIIATICLLQPLEVGRIIYALFNPDYLEEGGKFMEYALLARPVMLEGSFIETLQSNIWNGQFYSNIWQVENGRLFQVAALFMYGMLLGRREYFVRSSNAIQFWRKTLTYSALSFLPLYLLSTYLPDTMTNRTILTSVRIILPSFSNFAFMGILISFFTLCWFKKEGYKFQQFIIPYGRMSLTNYITQSILGVTLYYGFGLVLYKVTGATATIFIGLCIFAIQYFFSRWWLTKFRQGPLEFLWRKATWI